MEYKRPPPDRVSSSFFFLSLVSFGGFALSLSLPMRCVYVYRVSANRKKRKRATDECGHHSNAKWLIVSVFLLLLLPYSFMKEEVTAKLKPNYFSLMISKINQSLSFEKEKKNRLLVLAGSVSQSRRAELDDIILMKRYHSYSTWSETTSSCSGLSIFFSKLMKSWFTSSFCLTFVCLCRYRSSGWRKKKLASRSLLSLVSGGRACALTNVGLSGRVVMASNIPLSCPWLFV